MPAGPLPGVVPAPPVGAGLGTDVAEGLGEADGGCAGVAEGLGDADGTVAAGGSVADTPSAAPVPPEPQPATAPNASSIPASAVARRTRGRPTGRSFVSTTITDFLPRAGRRSLPGGTAPV